jgi:ribosomal subunit interface protein
MKINISGDMELGESLPVYVKEKLEKEISKYFADAPSVEVNLNKQNTFIHANINVNSKVNADCEDADVHKAFDGALSRLVILLRKEKDKIVTERRKIKKD